MTCAIHNVGSKVWIETAVNIINESTKRASITPKRMEGTITGKDSSLHRVKVYLPELNESVFVDAINVRKKE